MKLTRELVVFDLEATGIWVEKDKIIEIAMIKVSPDGTRSEYQKRVNPTIPIPPEVTELTGISNHDIAQAPTFLEIYKEVLEFIGDADVGGFNVERYDLPLLEREVSEAGGSFQWRDRNVYDVQKVYHLNEKRDLTAAYKFYCGEDLKDAHAAMADTQATLSILEKQVERYGSGDKQLEDLKGYDYKQLHDFYDSDRKFRWWNGKLYMMFGKYARKYTLQEVVKKDRGYLEWVLSSNFSEEVKRLVSNALNGDFPTR